ncbi:MAG: hypothetical protein WCB94_02380, partial [Terriglobales bacterium]
LSSSQKQSFKGSMHQVCTREGMMRLNVNVKTAGGFIAEMASSGALLQLFTCARLQVCTLAFLMN